MAGRCHCGSESDRHYELGCVECGAGCCPDCAIYLESASYCRRCAQSLLDAPAVAVGGTFDVH